VEVSIASFNRMLELDAKLANVSTATEVPVATLDPVKG
jgi:hypothetical protein